MFNWQRCAIGMAISHDLTIVNINKRGKLLKKAKYPLTESIIQQGEIIDAPLLLNNIDLRFRGKSLTLAIDDHWIEQQSFTIPRAPLKAILYLIKQKALPENVYDYYIYQNQCILWQLAKTRYHSYQLLAKKLGLTLTAIEPQFCAHLRLFTQPLPQPYAIYYSPTLYIIHQDTLIFTHHVLKDEIESAIILFEQLHQQKIKHLVSNKPYTTSRKLILINASIDANFLTAYAAATRNRHV